MPEVGFAGLEPFRRMLVRGRTFSALPRAVVEDARQRRPLQLDLPVVAGHPYRNERDPVLRDLVHYPGARSARTGAVATRAVRDGRWE